MPKTCYGVCLTVIHKSCSDTVTLQKCSYLLHFKNEIPICNFIICFTVIIIIMKNKDFLYE